jgi:hypothetical protein
MKRLSLLLFLGLALSTAFSGCLAGPGVEPPRAESEDEQAGAGGSTYTREPGQPGAGDSQVSAGTGAPTMTTGGTTAATGGAGGTAAPMDASIADGAASIDSGIGDGGTGRDAGVDDDAGSEQ